MFDQSLSLSDTLGGLSILTWLGAQSPQIYENYKNKSVEGLALPFLISWFWGDFTNFIGCVLTHQLPFQTYLASYFLIVDVLLVSQYYYYSRHGKPPLNLPPLSESFPYAQAPTTTHPHHPTRRPSSSSRKRSLSTRRSNSYIQHPHQHQHQHQHQQHREDGGDSNNNLKNSFMSETTSSIKGGTGGTSSRGFSSNRIRQFSNPNSNPSTSSSSSLLLDGNNSNIEQQQQRGRTLIRNSNLMIGGGTFDPTLSTIYGSPSVTLPPPPPPPPPQVDTQSQSQHVSFNPTSSSSSTPSSISSSSYSDHHLQNDQNHHHHHHHPAATEVEELDRYTTHELRRTTSSSRSSTSRPRPPISRANTASGLVFLSIGLLFTIGSNLQSNSMGTSSFGLTRRSSGGRQGEAWSTSNSQITKMEEEREESLGGGKMIEIRWKGDEMFSDKNEIERVVVVNPSSTSVSISSSSSISSSTLKEGNQDQDRDDTKGGGSGPDYERIIGRTSAWLCTTLYLTSRLPQIWRNFRRRSVEGLAMTLFFFAFVGNTLYVLSILTNPLKKTDPGYLVESTPYLLGSGGTVCFDLMILFQSLIYSSNNNGSHSSRKRGKRLLLTSREEEEGLLEEEGGEGEGEGETDLESETTMGRRRGRRSRDSSLKSFRSSSQRSISRQSQSHRGGNQLSMTRSRSTDHFFTTTEREREREEQTPRRMTPSRVNSSNSRDSIPLRREETILEAGESAVTVRT